MSTALSSPDDTVSTEHKMPSKEASMTSSQICQTVSPLAPQDITRRNLHAAIEFANTYVGEDASIWYAPWISILNRVFPIKDGYILTPRQQSDHDSRGEWQLPRYTIEVAKLMQLPRKFCTVLIVGIADESHWKSYRAKGTLERHVERMAQDAHKSTGGMTIYWINAFGSHWRYGVSHEDDNEIEALIDYNDSMDDDKSWRDLEDLSKLVADLCGPILDEHERPGLTCWE